MSNVDRWHREPPLSVCTAKGSKKIRAITLLASIAVAAGGFGLGGETAAGQARADTGVYCLWSGEARPQGVTIAAGGWMFRCQSDVFGFSRWDREGRTSAQSNVHSSGTTGNPINQFSPGAVQPGTDYMDYCVGSQLIEGRESMYEAIADGRGGLFWRSAGPISQWSFDSNSSRPGPSWRSASLCIDGNLT